MALIRLCLQGRHRLRPGTVKPSFPSKFPLTSKGVAIPSVFHSFSRKTNFPESQFLWRASSLSSSSSSRPFHPPSLRTSSFASFSTRRTKPSKPSRGARRPPQQSPRAPDDGHDGHHGMNQNQSQSQDRSGNGSDADPSYRDRIHARITVRVTNLLLFLEKLSALLQRNAKWVMLALVGVIGLGVGTEAAFRLHQDFSRRRELTEGAIDELLHSDSAGPTVNEEEISRIADLFDATPDVQVRPCQQRTPYCCPPNDCFLSLFFVLSFHFHYPFFLVNLIQRNE